MQCRTLFCHPYGPGGMGSFFLEVKRSPIFFEGYPAGVYQNLPRRAEGAFSRFVQRVACNEIPLQGQAVAARLRRAVKNIYALRKYFLKTVTNNFSQSVRFFRKLFFVRKIFLLKKQQKLFQKLSNTFEIFGIFKFGKNTYSGKKSF